MRDDSSASRFEPAGFPFARLNPLDPPPEYARLRSEAPMARAKLYNGEEVWLVTRWKDVREVLASPHFSVDPGKKGYPSASAARAAEVQSRKTFINMDAPDHMRIRRMLTRDFMQKRMIEMRPMVQKKVDELIDKMIRKGPPADFVEDLAAPLPVHVISIMLGVPAEDQEMLREWSRIRNTHSYSPEEIRQASQSMEAHLEKLIAQKEAHPGADMLTRLVEEQIKPGHATREEVARLGSLLYAAGHETTTNQLGLSLLSLLLDPEQRALLESNPAMMATAIEEMLRFHSITQFNSARVATADVEIGGHLIRAGEGVYALVAAANRDPEAFPDPDRFDIQRNPKNAHVAFAYGPHQCLGQPLARLEMDVVISTLFKRLPGLELAVPLESLKYNFMTQVHGLQALPVAWKA